MGITWAVLTPALMVFVFTFVFGEIFKSKWPGTDQAGGINFAAAIFSGLIVFTFFSEVISRSPNSILENQSYVKKVVFPIEILSIVNVLVASSQMFLSYAVVVVLLQFSDWSFGLNALWIFLIVLPLMLVAVGLAWVISALGVYVRDIGQIISPILTGTMFLSPIFYDLSSVDARIHWLYKLNPLTIPIEASRSALLKNQSPDLLTYSLYCLISALVAYVGYLFFQSIRRGFADVL